MKKKILIVGAGQAACSLAGKYRQQDSEAAITIVGEERYLPYQRPPLSKKYVTGEMSVESLFLRPEAWYQKNDISLLSGHRVVRIVSSKVSMSFVASTMRTLLQPKLLRGGVPW